jgi:hypothetical protein
MKNARQQMTIDIYYHLGAMDGRSSSETKDAAIDRGCALIAMGAEITAVKGDNETLRTALTIAEIYYESARRQGVH